MYTNPRSPSSRIQIIREKPTEPLEAEFSDYFVLSFSAAGYDFVLILSPISTSEAIFIAEGMQAKSRGTWDGRVLTGRAYNLKFVKNRRRYR